MYCCCQRCVLHNPGHPHGMNDATAPWVLKTGHALALATLLATLLTRLLTTLPTRLLTTLLASFHTTFLNGLQSEREQLRNTAGQRGFKQWAKILYGAGVFTATAEQASVRPQAIRREKQGPAGTNTSCVGFHLVAGGGIRYDNRPTQYSYDTVFV